MTSATLDPTRTPAPAPAPASAPGSGRPAATARVRRRSTPRLLGLARAELTLLLRNRMQLFTALLLPLSVPFLYLPLARAGGTPETLAAGLGTMFVVALLFVVYYNLLSSYVARRQDLVLKRLRTGEASDATVLTATAVPALLVAGVMIVAMGSIATPLLDLPLPQNPLVLLVGLALGAVVMVPLALVTANFTRTVEAAQITSLPMMAVLIIGAGAAIPLGMMPDWFGRLIALVPSAPIAAMVRLGWLGIDADGAVVTGTELWTQTAAQSAILLVWLGLGLWYVRTHLRWEPRG
ncbi:ABC transporter permease [Brachybacterium muris]|uniref:ABC transporter permease n=1 Tax=Brachybacterium muris TaxID=219301 RepID=UPI00223C286D|nr:ABC transporter permease [Brachybacterium muris]MCT1653634.1 ABC transporter permease [Brachybacterium muris]